MKGNIYKTVLGAALAAGLACVPLSATPVGAGEFNIAGQVYVTSTSILFGLDNNVPPTSQTAAIVPPETGPFAGLTFGQTVGLKNVTSPTDPMGNISIPQWIILPNGIDLDLANIAVPPAGTPICSAANDTPGSPSCIIAPGSHILLSEGFPDVNGNPTVSASLTVSGIAYTGSASTGDSTFQGTLSNQFAMTNVTSLIAKFGAQGFINTSYSGTFVTTVIPEPGTFAALGLGMLVLGSLRKKIRSSKPE